MIFEAATVSLAALDRRDNYYRISQGAPLEPLSGSIARIGLVSPLLVMPQGDRYRMISGFRRAAACEQLGWSKVAVRCIDPGTPSVDRAIMAIDAKRLQRPLTVMETARSLRLLARACPDMAQCRTTARALDLPNRSEIIVQWQRLADAPESIQAAVDDNRLAFPMAQRLLDLPTDAAIAVTQLFMATGFGLNKQRECLDWLEDIARREHRSIGDVVLDSKVQSVLSDTTDRGQTGSFVRDTLRTWRFPTLVRLQENQQELLSALPLSSAVQLTPPPYFEGTQYWLRLGFDSLMALKAHHQTLDALVESAALHQLMTGAEPETEEPS